MAIAPALVILVPLLPLLAAAFVLVGKPETQHERATVGVLPLAAAFVVAVVTLVVVASKGPIGIRFYESSSLARLALPLGFHIDRLSAVMMVLISGIGAIIYR